MSNNLKLVIGKPQGTKGDKLLSSAARLVNPVTGEVIPGVGDIRVSFPAKGLIVVAAEIQISDIEIEGEGEIAAGFNRPDQPIPANALVTITTREESK